MNSNSRTAFVLASLGFIAGAGAASHTQPASPEAVYRQERADCLSGRNHQDLKTCLKEAGAALAEARRGRLGETSPQQLAQNALLRCQRQPVQDRADCERLARGEGQRQGSVAQGAVIKEIVTLELPPTAAGPARAASSPGSSQ